MQPLKKLQFGIMWFLLTLGITPTSLWFVAPLHGWSIGQFYLPGQWARRNNPRKLRSQMLWVRWPREFSVIYSWVTITMWEGAETCWIKYNQLIEPELGHRWSWGGTRRSETTWYDSLALRIFTDDVNMTCTTGSLAWSHLLFLRFNWSLLRSLLSLIAFIDGQRHEQHSVLLYFLYQIGSRHVNALNMYESEMNILKLWRMLRNITLGCFTFVAS